MNFIDTTPDYAEVYTVYEEEKAYPLDLRYEPDYYYQYQPCKCGCCLSCVGLYERDFM